MAKRKVADSILYRWRYIIGYSVIGILLISSLVLAGTFVPGGLIEHEKVSVVTSASIDFSDPTSLSILNLPYHLLQLLSINLFGVTALSVKLPSLFLGALSAVGLIFLLRQWFHYNVSVIAAIVAIATSQFLFIAQNGTPLVLYLFWPIWLLLSATLIARQVKPVLLWRILFFILAALSLYTPFSIYVLVALAMAVALHPHLRYLFRRIPTSDLTISIIVASLLLIPLGYRLVMQPEIGLELLGFASGHPDILANLTTLGTQLFDFTGTSVSLNGMMLPLFGLGSMLLIALGIFAAIKAWHSVKSYLVLLWLLLLIPALVIEPAYIAIIFVPLVLLLASGLDALFRYWYRLFPLNPYARVAGLIPIAILVSGLVMSGLDRYTYGYLYSDVVAGRFSNDISLINREISNGKSPTAIIVKDSNYAFYQTVAERSPGQITAHTELPDELPEKVIISGARHEAAPEGKELDKIITDGRKLSGDRFYVYKNPRT